MEADLLSCRHELELLFLFITRTLFLPNPKKPSEQFSTLSTLFSANRAAGIQSQAWVSHSFYLMSRHKIHLRENFFCCCFSLDMCTEKAWALAHQSSFALPRYGGATCRAAMDPVWAPHTQLAKQSPKWRLCWGSAPVAYASHLQCGVTRYTWPHWWWGVDGSRQKCWQWWWGPSTPHTSECMEGPNAILLYLFDKYRFDLPSPKTAVIAQLVAMGCTCA